MTVLDANVLLYAYNSDAPQQPRAARWLKQLLDSGETIGLPWLTLWAFIRIATNSRIWHNPLSAVRAFAIIEEWLAQPGIVVVQPGPRHTEILKRIIGNYRVTGPLVIDAVLAALALENGASVSSADQGFRRFSEVRWVDPLSE